MRNGLTVGTLPTSGSPQWEFAFRADVDPSSIEVAEATSIAVDESAGVFAFVVRVGGEWRHDRRVDIGDRIEPPAAESRLRRRSIGPGR